MYNRQCIFFPIANKQWSLYFCLTVIFGRWKSSLIATTVVLVLVLVVTPIRKMPKALLIRNGKLRNFAYTFVTSFPTDLPSQIFKVNSY